MLYCNDHANLVLINSDDFDYRKHHDFVSRLIKTMAGDRDDDQDDLKMSIAFSFVLEDNETGIGF